METTSFNLIILGGGPGGYTAAEEAARAGLSVCLVHDSPLGGTCLHWGCIPTKGLLHSAGKPDFSWNTEQKRLLSAQAKLQKAILKKLTKLGVTLLQAHGRIIESTPERVLIAAGDAQIIAETLIIATGSRPTIPAIPGVDHPMVSTSKQFLARETLPEQLVIIGGGVIAIEFATFCAAAGVAVTLLEATDSLGGAALDSDCAKLLQKNLSQQVTIATDVSVTEITRSSVAATIHGREQLFKADAVLIATGRRALVEAIGLDQTSASIRNESIHTYGSIGRTDQTNIYAIGDCAGGSLAHQASHEARLAIASILGAGNGATSFPDYPAVIYSTPAVVSIGQSADQLPLGYRLIKRPLGGNGRFVAEGEPLRGICKIVIDPQDRIAGVHLIAPYADEIAAAAAMMVQLKLPRLAVKGLVFPHPTISEILIETLLEDR